MLLLNNENLREVNINYPRVSHFELDVSFYNFNVSFFFFLINKRSIYIKNQKDKRIYKGSTPITKIKTRGAPAITKIIWMK